MKEPSDGVGQGSGTSRSTITRHVDRPADRDAVETWMDGRTKVARPTTTGRLLLGPSTDPELASPSG